MQTVSFTKFILEYFGRKPGQTAMELQAEIKALTPEDRAELSRLAPTVGYTISPIVQ